MKNYFYRFAYRTQWLLAVQMGFDVRKFVLFLRGFPGYVRDYLKFRKNYKGPLNFLLCVHDRFEDGGDVNSEYFWQDLLVARKIADAKPQRHVDVGSRVDGFIAHVASFRQIEVLDVRPIHKTIPGVVFKQADLMSPLSAMRNYCDSLSCLHALEHFGLGRYGDPINPDGFDLGFKNLVDVLSPDGMFYLSFPIGEGRVEFNSHRVVDPRHLLACAEDAGLDFLEVTLIHRNASGPRIETFPPQKFDIEGILKEWYVLAVFVFKKRV